MGTSQPCQFKLKIISNTLRCETRTGQNQGCFLACRVPRDRCFRPAPLSSSYQTEAKASNGRNAYSQSLSERGFCWWCVVKDKPMSHRCLSVFRGFSRLLNHEIINCAFFRLDHLFARLISKRNVILKY